LQIYQWVCQWKNFENRLTFGEVMGKSLVSCFFETQCTIVYDLFHIWSVSSHRNCRCHLTDIQQLWIFRQSDCWCSRRLLEDCLPWSLVRIARTELNWPELVDPVKPNVHAHRTVQRDIDQLRSMTDSKHSELSRIVCELQFARCERSHRTPV